MSIRSLWQNDAIRIPRKNGAALALLVLGSCLFSYTVARAIFVPISHDEANNFFYIFAYGIDKVITFAFESSSNHILNSLLVRLSLETFGHSKLAMRLPNLLAHVIYLLSSFFLVRQLKNRVLVVIGFLILNINPFLLDFFSLARGYGLACSFTMLSLCFAVRMFSTSLRDDTVYSRSLWAGFFAVLANFSFINYYVALVATTITARILTVLKGQSIAVSFSSVRQLYRVVVVENIVALRNVLILAIVVAPPLIKLILKKELYFGGITGFRADTIQSLIEASLYDVILTPELVSNLAWVIVVYLIALVAFTLYRVIRGQMNESAHILLGLESLLLCCVVLVLCENAFFNIKFPIQRTALYFLLLFLSVVVFSLDQMLVCKERWRRRISWSLVAILSLGLSLPWVTSLNLTHEYYTKYDADTPQMLELLNKDRLSSGLTNRKARLGANWLLRPAINYYIVTRQMDWLEPVAEEEFSKNYDYYYFKPEDKEKLANYRLSVVHEFKITKNILARRIGFASFDQSIPDPPPYRASLMTPQGHYEVLEGDTLRISVQVRNEGSHAWSSAGEAPILLSYHVYSSTGQLLSWDNPRTPFPNPVRPGEERTPFLEVAVPQQPGAYTLEVDLVHEGVTWFAWKGSKPLRVSLQVQDIFASGDSQPSSLGYGSESVTWVEVKSLNKLARLIAVTLQHNAHHFAGKTGQVFGFAAGKGYPQLWLRDSATVIPAARYFFDQKYLVSWIYEHLAHQQMDGSVYDFIAPEGEAEKNTVETDQEASLLLAAWQYTEIAGPLWLRKTVQGRRIIDRLEQALLYVFTHRYDDNSGLVTGAHTADWGDAESSYPDMRAVDVSDRTHWTTDIYDQAMAYAAANALVKMFDMLGEKERMQVWRHRAKQLRERANAVLWQEERGFYKVHRHLDDLQHPFDEDNIFPLGGNAMAILSGLAAREQAEKIFAVALERQKLFNVSTLSGSLLPCYPQGFFANPSLDDYFEYQNGGQWDWFGGRMIYALYENGHSQVATEKLLEVAEKAVANRRLYEWDTLTGQGRGSADYAGSAGALGLALYQGLLGVKLTYEGLLLQPRLGLHAARVHLFQPAGDRFVAYDYLVDPHSRTVRFQYNSNIKTTGMVSLLIPFGNSSPLSVEVDGRTIEYRVDQVGQDRFVTFHTDFHHHVANVHFE